MTKFPVIASLGPLIALVLACVFFSAQSDRFLSLQNVVLILQQVMWVGTTAIGQTLVILTAGIDLRCVAVFTLDGTTMTKLAVKSGLNFCLAIACGTAACMAFGLVNGLRMTRSKPPLLSLAWA